MKPGLIIAERDDALAEKLKASLIQMGYDVLACVRSRSAAVELVRARHPQLVFIDPDLDGDLGGIETADIIGREFHTPVIFLALRSERTFLRRALAPHVYGLITESFDPVSLRVMIDLALLHDQEAKSLREQNEKGYDILNRIGDYISSVRPKNVHEYEQSVHTLLSRTCILDESPNPVFRVTKQGTVVYSNQSGQKLLQDMGAKPGQNLPEKYLTSIDDALQSERSHTVAVEIAEKTYRMSLVPNLRENCVSFYGRGFVSADYSAGPMQGSELRFRALVEKRSDIACCLSSDGVLTFVNPAFSAFFSRPREELIGMSFTKVLGLDDDTLIDTTLSSLNKDEQVIKFERHLYNGKKECWIEWDCRAVFGGVKEEIVEILVTGREISDRKRLADLEREKEIVDSASRIKTEFLSNVSHELRTPVAGILGMADLLLDTLLTLEQQEYTQTIRNSAQALLSIINDLLDFSRIDEGKLKIDMKDFDLRQAVEDVGRLLASRASEKNLELILHYSMTAPSKVHGDSGRVRQILLNLVNNAIKFTHEGYVLLYVDSIHHGDGMNQFSLTVEDSGIGIPRDKLSMIFDRFTQADSSTTRFYGGTGLGLAISSQLARWMGGDIGVDSSPGCGTTFYFSIPLAPSKEKEEILPTLQTYSHLLSLYLVSPNDVLRRFYRRICHECGIECEVCTEHEILGILANTRRDRVCVVMLDQRIEGHGCFMLAKEIKERFHGDFLKLMLLANPDVVLEDIEAQDAPFDGILYKPLYPRAFVRRLLSLLFPDVVDESENQRRVSDSIAQANPDGSVGASRGEFEDARVLLVEDNAVNQKVAVRMLEKLGVRVALANHGQEAIEKLTQEKFDLVLMDCQMPVMDGYAATRAIRDPRSRVYDPDLPIVALTAHRGTDENARTQAVGMNGFLSKPLQKNDLRDTLKTWVRRGRAGEASEASEASGPAGVALVEQAAAGGASGASGPAGVAPVEQAAAGGAAQVFDHAGVMERLENDENLLRELIQVYMESLDEQLAAIQEALDAGNAPAAENHAHALKGGSSNIGAERLRRRFYDMEVAGREGRLDDFAKLFRDVPFLANELTGVLTANGYLTGG